MIYSATKTEPFDFEIKFVFTNAFAYNFGVPALMLVGNNV